MGTRFSAPVQTGPGAHPASCTMGTGSFPGVKSGRGVTLTPNPLLVAWSRKSRAIPLLPLWAVRPVQSLSACTRVLFSLLYANELHRICQPVSVAAQSKGWVCGRSPAEIVGSNPTAARTPGSFECCVLSDRGFCYELITGPEESYRL